MSIHPTNPTSEVTAMSTFSATIVAAHADAALACVERYLSSVEGFAATGRVAVRSERHLLWSVEVEDLGGDPDDCWTVLSSNGVSPSPELGSRWETILGASAR